MPAQYVCQLISHLLDVAGPDILFDSRLVVWNRHLFRQLVLVGLSQCSLLL